MRIVLEALARSKNLDPLAPSTWYSIPKEELYRETVFSKILLFN